MLRSTTQRTRPRWLLDSMRRRAIRTLIRDGAGSRGSVCTIRPVASTSRWYFMPGLPRLVGFGPLSSPAFCADGDAVDAAGRPVRSAGSQRLHVESDEGWILFGYVVNDRSAAASERHAGQAG